MGQNVANICRSIDFLGGSKFTRASGGPQNGGKMTGMDYLNLEILTGWVQCLNKAQFVQPGAFAGFPPPGLFRVKTTASPQKF